MRLSNALFATAGFALLIAAGPLLSVMLAAAVAGVAGCVLHEGSPQPCVVLGMDLGPLLYRMAVSFWLFIFSLLYVPVASVLAIAGGVMRWREKRGGEAIARVGGPYWLAASGGLALPLDPVLGIALLAAAAAFFGRRRLTRPR